MTKRILWEAKAYDTKIRLIYFFSNENASCKKSYTPCYAPVIVLKGSRSSAEDR